MKTVIVKICNFHEYDKLRLETVFSLAYKFYSKTWVYDHNKILYFQITGKYRNPVPIDYEDLPPIPVITFDEYELLKTLEPTYFGKVINQIKHFFYNVKRFTANV